MTDDGAKSDGGGGGGNQDASARSPPFERALARAMTRGDGHRVDHIFSSSQISADFYASGNTRRSLAYSIIAPFAASSILAASGKLNRQQSARAILDRGN